MGVGRKKWTERRFLADRQVKVAKQKVKSGTFGNYPASSGQAATKSSVKFFVFVGDEISRTDSRNFLPRR